MQRSRFKKLSGPFSALILYVTTSCCQSANAVITHDQGRFTQSVKIGNTSAADSTAALDIVSITKGVLFPRMTTTQRTAISSPATGLTVYDTDLSSYMVFNSTWKALVDVSASQTLSNKSISGDANTVTNLGIGTLKTVIGNATKFLSFDGTGAPVATKAVPTGVVVGDSDTQTLTNKTYQTNQPIAMAQQISTPSAPLAGSDSLYFKNDDKLYYQTSAGVEQAVGTGSGAGGTEYIKNTDAESATSFWSTYADAAGSSPVDGTGGTASSLTFSRTTTSGEFIRGTASFKLAKAAANAQGQGVSIDFTVDAQDKSGPVYISFDYTASTNFANGDVKLFVYDKDAGGTPIGVVDSIGAAGAIQAGNTRMTAVFYPTTTTSRNYRLIFHTATTNALAYTFIFDNVHTGGANLIPGAIVTSPVPWTPTGSWTTNTTYTGMKWRVGNRAYYHVSITLSGAPTSANLTVNLPGGEVIDASTSNIGVSETLSADAMGVDNGVNSYPMLVTYLSTSSVLLTIVNAAGTYAVNPPATATTPFTWGTGDHIEFIFSVPIVGWTSGAQVSTGELIQQTPTPAATVTSQFTGVTSGTWNAMSNNSLTLPAGVYDLTMSAEFGQVGGTPVYSYSSIGVYAANGTNTGTEPAYLSSSTSLQVLSACSGSCGEYNASVADFHRRAPQPVRVKVLSPTTVYVVTRADATTMSRVRVNAYLTAAKVPDFTTYGVVPNAQVALAYWSFAATSLPVSTVTGVPFATKDYDPGSWFNGTTFTAPYAGKYRVNVSVVTAANTLASAGTISVQLFKNGGFYKVLSAIVGNAVNVLRPLNGATTVPMAMGDTLDIRIYTDVATTINSSAGFNRLEIEKVAD